MRALRYVQQMERVNCHLLSFPCCHFFFVAFTLRSRFADWILHRRGTPDVVGNATFPFSVPVTMCVNDRSSLRTPAFVTSSKSSFGRRDDFTVLQSRVHG